MVAEREGFLGRWARRKADVREGKPLAEPVVAVPEPMAPSPGGQLCLQTPAGQ